jgi:hypothetical protein
VLGDQGAGEDEGVAGLHGRLLVSRG